MNRDLGTPDPESGSPKEPDHQDLTLPQRGAAGAGAGRKDLIKDALAEVANIAAGHAATTLGDMLDERLMITVTGCHMLEVEEVPGFFGDLDQMVGAVLMELLGSVEGYVMIFFPLASGRALAARTMLKQTVSQEGDFSEVERAALTELGNIIICAYLNAISEFLGTSLFPSPPSLAIDQLGAVLETPSALLAARGDLALVLETRFSSDQGDVSGYFLYTPDKPTQERILARFGVSGDR